MYDESSDPFDGMSPEDMIKQILPDKVFNDQMDAYKQGSGENPDLFNITHNHFHDML